MKPKQKVNMTEKKDHPQAKWLRAIADGETLQCNSLWNAVPRWTDVSPSAALSFIGATPDIEGQLRIKPRTITIGKYEVAEPMKVAPRHGASYYVLDQLEDDGVFEHTWGGDSADKTFMESGMCWLRREDAELAAKAITELLTGK